MTAINMFIKHHSGYANVNEFWEAHDFMTTVMALTEIGNEMLEGMQSSSKTDK